MMVIKLSDFEAARAYDGDYEADLCSVQVRLARIQSAYIIHGKSAIIMVEGWDASGKAGVITRLTARMDPRYYAAWPISALLHEKNTRHFLWPYWKSLPGAGQFSLFDHGWYRHVLALRIEGADRETDWTRGFDEVNEFESQQSENNIALIKIFLHITAREQDERFRERSENAWKQHRIIIDDFYRRERRADYMRAYEDMFERTDTRWAPWTVIDANDKKSAQISALTTIADKLEKSVSMIPPPINPELLAMARAALAPSSDINNLDKPHPGGDFPK
jgi:AMP-polyphosphate phosphotransferase